VTPREVNSLEDDEVMPAFWWEYMRACAEINYKMPIDKAFLVGSVQMPPKWNGMSLLGGVDSFVSVVNDTWAAGCYRWRVVRAFTRCAAADFVRNERWLELGVRVRRRIVNQFPAVSRIWVQTEAANPAMVPEPPMKHSYGKLVLWVDWSAPTAQLVEDFRGVVERFRPLGIRPIRGMGLPHENFPGCRAALRWLGVRNHRLLGNNGRPCAWGKMSPFYGGCSIQQLMNEKRWADSVLHWVRTGDPDHLQILPGAEKRRGDN